LFVSKNIRVNIVSSAYEMPIMSEKIISVAYVPIFSIYLCLKKAVVYLANSGTY